jgi:hypothetical protein
MIFLSPTGVGCGIMSNQSSVMKSRRLTRSPRRHGRATALSSGNARRARSCLTGVKSPLVCGDVFALEYPAREVYPAPSSPKFIRPSGGGIRYERQQPIQNVLAEPARVDGKWQPNFVRKDFKAMSGDDAIERVALRFAS